MGNSILISNLTPDELSESLRQIVKEEIANIQLQKDIPKYLTREQTAEILHITLPTLNEYTRAGRIKGSRIGSRVLYNEEAVREAVKEIPTLKYRRG